jgi:diacylglycerol kinase family enzyme
VHIAAYPKQPVQVDGEVVGNTPCEIRVVPNAIQVCMPSALLPSDGQSG